MAAHGELSKMNPLTLLPLLILTSEAARLVEEIILRDGDQWEREERRFESDVSISDCLKI